MRVIALDTSKHWDGPPLDAWRAWHPAEAAARLFGLAAPWCVVGGWSIDLWLGRPTRPHDDLEIAVPRGSFTEVRARLRDYALFSVGDGEVRTLAPDTEPPPERHQNWVLDVAANAWRMDVMLEPGDAHTWVFRRNPAITAPRSQMIGERNGIPFLRPTGTLLFKAKSTRPKDEADFAVCLPQLDVAERGWLHDAIERTHPGHAWLAALQGR